MIGDRTRASDSERERVVGLLRDAAIVGRLTVEELDERCERAYSAVTRGELAALLHDLPVPRAAPAPPPPRPLPQYPAPSALREWMAGRVPFVVTWRGPADPRIAGEHILEHIVPIFTAEDYTIVRRTANSLVLEQEASALVSLAALARIVDEPGRVIITMTARADHSIMEIRGAASQEIRRALASLSR